MLRLSKKKSTRSLFWSMIVIFALCFATAFIYYFVLVEELDAKTEIAINRERVISIEEEISARLTGLERGLKQNRDLLKNIRYKLDRVVKDFNNGDKSEIIDQISYARDRSNCLLQKQSRNGANISMFDIYEKLAFNNADGGVWKQGWDVKYENSDVNGEKLKIFVVPHSHNDPGWIKTFDKYFHDQTKSILDCTVNKLRENDRMKFIWAETSYLSAWFDVTKSDDAKRRMKDLLHNGQMEIVTGGWVMNDEAATHYFAMITQMVEGHEWLQENLNYKPKYGWAIDPFGLSPTMAFILKKMGFKGMVIQRVHYEIKKHLSMNKQLEFRWRQYWENDNDDNSDILCHVEPFYSYDVPHTCGPDPKVCCQFDFKRLPPSRVKCPWKVSPQRITENNIHERASLLMDQYRKKAVLYRTKSLLVPLGDDFRFDKTNEWDDQRDNYLRLFDYINSRHEWNTEIKFATLSEYFESLPLTKQFPTLNGDFFTYSDRDDHYWSGFYTSKPFYKRFDRILESHLRSAEIIYSLASIFDAKIGEDLNSFLPLLVYARQNLALFQHHDGITGTAKEAVVNDYAMRMFKSLENLELIMGKSIMEILHYDTGENLNGPLKLMETLPKPDLPPQKKVLYLTREMNSWYFVIYNSLAHTRVELICIHIATNYTNWCVKNSNGVTIEDIQVNFVWSMDVLMLDRFEVCFMAHLNGLSLNEYRIVLCDDKKVPTKVSQTLLYNYPEPQISNAIVSLKEVPTEILLESDMMQLIFSGADGMLRKVGISDENNYFNTYDIRMSFMTYGTRSGKKTPKSGAYIFLPDDENAQNLVYSKPKIRVTKGSIVNKFELIIETPIPIRHQICIVNGKRHFDVENEFHLSKGTFGNKELMMRLYTNIQNDDTFYSDLNGFQMIKRKRYDKIPLQGNVYPMPTMAYIEDRKTRLNIMTGQPLGVTSRRSGWIDVFLDRRLLQDDQRGLNQGVVDNKRTRETFKVLFESTPSDALKPSLEAQTELQRLLYLPIIMYSNMKSTISQINFIQSPLPCNIHLLNLRRLSQNQLSLFLHHLGISCDTNCVNSNSSDLILSKSFSPILIKALNPQISQMSLSLLHVIRDNVSLHEKLLIDEMDIGVYKLSKH